MKSFVRIEFDPAKLKAARGGRGMRECAELLGITNQYLWQLEKGLRGMDDALLARLCTLYGVRPADLLSTQAQRFLTAA
jgi:transcriptional regulator with XRE-family HTH domain